MTALLSSGCSGPAARPEEGRSSTPSDPGVQTPSDGAGTDSAGGPDTSAGGVDGDGGAEGGSDASAAHGTFLYASTQFQSADPAEQEPARRSSEYRVEVQAVDRQLRRHSYFTTGPEPYYVAEYVRTDRGIEFRRRQDAGRPAVVASEGSLYAPDADVRSWRLEFRDTDGRTVAAGMGVALGDHSVRVGSTDVECQRFELTIEWTMPAPARETRAYCYSAERAIPLEERVEFRGSGFLAVLEGRLRSL